MIKIVINNMEAEIAPAHYIMLCSGIMRLIEDLRESVTTAFINGNEKDFKTIENERQRAAGLLISLDELGNSFSPTELADANKWIDNL